MPFGLGLLLAVQAEGVSARHLAHLPSAKPQQGYSTKQPGTGYPGRLTPYVTRSAKLKVLMRRYSMSAGWFVRDPVDEIVHYINRRTCATNAIPYLLYSPKRPHGPLPLIVYFGGPDTAWVPRRVFRDSRSVPSGACSGGGEMVICAAQEKRA